MVKKINLLIHSVVFILLLQTAYVQANLLISPTKVIFKDRQRSEKLTLINTGDTTRTYRLKWREMKSLATGQYEELTAEEIKDFPTASSMIRFSPKQVTLKAGGRQTIKLAVRRPKNLTEGESRSHLVLTALPPKREAEGDDNELSMNLSVLISYSLPVIVRKGAATEPELSIDSIKLAYQTLKNDSYVEKSKASANIEVKISRSGSYSSNGNIIAYWKGASDKEEEIVTRIHDLTIYSEVEQAKINLTWPNAYITNGQLRVVYEGRGKFTGEIFAEKIIQVTPSSFQKISE